MFDLWDFLRYWSHIQGVKSVTELTQKSNIYRGMICNYMIWILTLDLIFFEGLKLLRIHRRSIPDHHIKVWEIFQKIDFDFKNCIFFAFSGFSTTRISHKFENYQPFRHNCEELNDESITKHSTFAQVNLEVTLTQFKRCPINNDRAGYFVSPL